MSHIDPYDHLYTRVVHLLTQIYADISPPVDVALVAKTLLQEMRLDHNTTQPVPHKNVWDQKDAWIITYGDTVLKEGEKPLKTLKACIDRYFSSVINGVHILPFYPYSSDDGFSVLDYSSVNETLGDWRDIKAIGENYLLMADLVINHCSSRSLWFRITLNKKIPVPVSLSPFRPRMI
jgi:sucrose phosphorylase